MPGWVIIAVYLPTVKQVRVKATVWWAINPTSVSCPFPAKKFLNEFLKIMMKILNMKFIAACLKSTMKKYRIY